MFTKAKPEQAALKLGVYGPTGSGKTFTGLLIAEGLAKRYGGRIAFIDTERGTDFYAQAVPDRTSHPEAFDFDCVYTRAVSEILKELRTLKYPEHCVICIDSVTHLWESCIAAYRGPKTRAGTIPMHAWGNIKKPYKELMHFLLNCRQHVIFMGRQTSEWGEDAEGETVQTGVKMRAEGETPYEPHILVRMEPVKPRTADGKKTLKNEVAIPTAFIEKDRTGILAGKLIEWPNYQSIAVPLLSLLGATQAKVQSDDEAGAIDAANAPPPQPVTPPKAPVKPPAEQLATMKAYWSNGVQRKDFGNALTRTDWNLANIHHAHAQGDLTESIFKRLEVGETVTVNELTDEQLKEAQKMVCEYLDGVKV